MNSDRLRFLYGKYLQGQCSPSEFAEMKRFFVMMRSADELLTVETVEAIAAKDIQLNSTRSQEILNHVLASRSIKSKARLPFYFKYAVAATVFIVGFVCFYLFRQQAEDYAIYRNSGQTVRRVILPDQSSVYLQPNASIRQLSNFSRDETRLVELKGDAFLAVYKDDKKPFIIHSPKGLVIRVLGTRFYANFRASDESVILTEGSVALKTAHDSLILKPQEMAVYRGGTTRLQQRKVDTLLFSAWVDNQLCFKEKVLSEVLIRLNDVYPEAGLRVSSKFYGLNFTGYLPTNDLDRAIQVLERTFANHNLTIIEKE